MIPDVHRALGPNLRATVSEPSLSEDVRERICSALDKPELVSMAASSSKWRQSALTSQHTRRPPILPGFEVRTRHEMQLLLEPKRAWSSRLRKWRFYKWDNSRVAAKALAATTLATGAVCSTLIGLRHLVAPPRLNCSRIPGDTCKLAAPQIVANAKHWGEDWAVSGSRCLYDLLRLCGYSSADVYWHNSKFRLQGDPEAPDLTGFFGDPQQLNKTVGVAAASVALAVVLALAVNHRLTMGTLRREKRADIDEQLLLAKLRGKQACCVFHPKQWAQQKRLAAKLNEFIESGDSAATHRLLAAGTPLYVLTRGHLPIDVATASLAKAVASGAAPESIELRRQLVDDLENACLQQRFMLEAQLEVEPPLSPYRSILENCLAHFQSLPAT